MRIQRKMMALTLLLAVALISATGVLFYTHNVETYRAHVELNLQMLAEKMALQLEGTLREMCFVAHYLASDPAFVSSLGAYSLLRENAQTRMYADIHARETIEPAMNNDAIQALQFQTVLLSEDGDFFSNDPSQLSPSAYLVKEYLRTSAFESFFASLPDPCRLLMPHADPWSEAPSMMYGIVRAVRTPAGDTYYFEVLSRTSQLDQMMQLISYEGTIISIREEGGSLFYSDAPDAPAEHSIWVSVISPPNAYGLTVDVSLDSAGVRPLTALLLTQIILLCVLAFLISATYIYLLTRRLTRPIQGLRAVMEKTELSNLQTITLPQGNDELESLGAAYLALLERLKRAADAQFQLQSQEMQARFDALQAQINPHFLYNTLNVIASRAMIIGDSEIIEICDGIARMLRYSTSTESRVATVREETAHVEAYLTLMSKRHRQRLAYEIAVDERLADEPVPKIVLQPLVENALRHGYKDIGGDMRIQLRGTIVGAMAVLEIEDNGAGFGEYALTALRKRFSDSLSQERPPGAIGGMGLVNTHARLLAYYGADFRMDLYDVAPHGAGIRIQFVRQ